jgi:hypothetical protein
MIPTYTPLHFARQSLWKPESAFKQPQRVQKEFLTWIYAQVQIVHVYSTPFFVKDNISFQKTSLPAVPRWLTSAQSLCNSTSWFFQVGSNRRSFLGDEWRPYHARYLAPRNSFYPPAYQTMPNQTRHHVARHVRQLPVDFSAFQYSEGIQASYISYENTICIMQAFFLIPWHVSNKEIFSGSLSSVPLFAIPVRMQFLRGLCPWVLQFPLPPPPGTLLRVPQLPDSAATNPPGGQTEKCDFRQPGGSARGGDNLLIRLDCMHNSRRQVFSTSLFLEMFFRPTSKTHILKE